MSTVTNVIVTCSLAEEPDNAESERWGDGYPVMPLHLKEVGRYAGGTKALEMLVFACALNYVETYTVLRELAKWPWVEPDNVVILIEEQEETRPRVYQLQHGVAVLKL